MQVVGNGAASALNSKFISVCIARNQERVVDCFGLCPRGKLISQAVVIVIPPLSREMLEPTYLKNVLMLTRPSALVASGNVQQNVYTISWEGRSESYTE